MPLGEAKAPTAQNHQWLNRKNESFVRTHRATSHQVDNFDPWRITPACIVPLGWPTGRYGPTTRRPVGEITSIDQYGNRAWLDADQG